MWRLILFLILVPSVLAEQIDFNRAIFDIDDGNTHLTNVIDFHLDKDIGFEINLPSNFDNLSVKSGGENLDYSFNDGKVIVEINNNTKEIIVEYDTKDLLKENSFVIDFESFLPSKFLFLEVWVDENYVAEKINPEAEEIIKEDGKIKIKWMFKDFSDNKRIVVLFNEKSNLGYFIMPVFALIVIIYLAINRRKA